MGQIQGAGRVSFPLPMTAVLLFDSFHLPRHANIAVAQGVKRAAATQAPLAEMTAPNSMPEEVRQMRDGHLLRWIKQMALRGRSREFDEAGVCGAQKLVFTGDLTLLMANLHRVFPGAKLTSQGDGKATHIDRLLRYLSSPGVLARVSTKELEGHFGRPWREFSHDITGHRDFGTLLRNAGWSYISKRGPSGAYFERTLWVYRRRLIELLRHKQDDDLGVLRPRADEQSHEPQGPGGSG